MKLYSIVLEMMDADDVELIQEIENTYNLSICNVSKFYTECAKSKGEPYCGGIHCLIIGKWYDIEIYLREGYACQDESELREYMEYITPLELS